MLHFLPNFLSYVWGSSASLAYYSFSFLCGKNYKQLTGKNNLYKSVPGAQTSIRAIITSRRKGVSALTSKIQCNYWLIFLPKKSSESGVSLALFLIVTIRTCNTTEGMQSSSMVWLLWASCQLCGRLSHSHRKCSIYQRTNGLQNLGQRSLPE